MDQALTVRWLGRRDFRETWSTMRSASQVLAAARDQELWMVEHDPVFTQGVAGRAMHVLDPGGIPVVACDRGGQVTYHGPGQVVAYPLVDLRLLGLHVKEYVYRLELAVLRLLESYGITGHRLVGAPGIYVRLDDPRGHAMLGPRGDPVTRFEGLGKIAALGLKVSHHRCWHGLALNVEMDLSPFSRIDPCGYRGLRTVDLATLGVQATWVDVAQRLASSLKVQLTSQRRTEHAASDNAGRAS